MKINIWTKGIFTLAIVSLVACNIETKQDERKYGEVPPTTNPAFMNLDAAPAATATPAGSATVTPVATQAPGTQAAPTTTAPGMNPPHGQPGHRCEIPVGAPLNSQPQAKPAAATPTQPTPAPANFSPPAAKPAPAPAVATAPGMNPPHGQPGHTCSVPVGAPLPKS